MLIASYFGYGNKKSEADNEAALQEISTVMPVVKCSEEQFDEVVASLGLPPFPAPADAISKDANPLGEK